MIDNRSLLKHTPLGHQTVYEDSYNPELLCPIARAESRKPLKLGHTLPFRGEDRWTAYEVSWLYESGKPCMAVAELIFSCNTRCVIESKSLKLYLNSLNQTVCESLEKLQQRIEQDLSHQAVGEVKVRLLPLSTDLLMIDSVPGSCLDTLDIQTDCYEPNAALLKYNPNAEAVSELVYSHLLKTNCPVTGQPDWATIFIEYYGRPLVHTQLLKYIISYRQHQDFHEHCVEQIFCDISQYCHPDKLTVYARYMRRGGLDINPLRTNFEYGESQLESLNLRISRQ